MPAIFSYDDYRKYLRDHYRERKASNKSYSFRFFARKAGLESPNYYKLVMDGQRNLTHRNIRKFIKGLGLGDREAIYFENLVALNQARDKDEREFFKKNLELARSEDDRVILTRDQHQALAKWYPLAIKELALVDGFQSSAKWIAGRLDHRITPQEVREAIELLARLGLIEVDPKSGEIRVTKQNMQTPDLAKSSSVALYHQAMIDLAQASIREQNSEQRCLSGLTVAVRKADLAEAFRRIHRFRNEMDSFFGKGKSYDAVYQLNLQLFRLDSDV